MRLTAFLDAGTPTMGVERGGGVVPLAPVEAFYADLDGWLARAAAGDGGPARPSAGLAPAVPVPPSAKILCVAVNYPMHADETGTELPERPNLFARWWATLVPDGTPIPVPADEPGLDWEVELAVVVGRHVTAPLAPEAAMGAVLGYTVFNDVSARAHQRATSQWANGKNADQSGPVGSTVVTADEVDPDDLRLRTTVGGQVMQDATTADMAIKVPGILAYATRTISLRPGDLIATGTPAGVGWRREPPVFLRPGDVVSVEVVGVGSVTNPVVDASHRR